MNNPEAYPTIVALSSAPGRAGVAVVRISGSRVRFVLETFSGVIPVPRQAVLRHLRDRDGETIDTGLVLFFPTPASFTGEDVAEFHVHGSRAVLARLLVALTALPGVRLAEAGEFTRRAFEAGKLDLAAVEGLADLIDSETEWQRRQALRQMEGALGSFAMGERVREGFVVVLAGPPNAGKSSLLNALAQRDVAIVSPIAGTTRDAWEVRLDLAGLPVILIDTAGLRDSVDPIEAEGVRRARTLLARADLALALRSIDSEPYRMDGEVPVLRLATKSDLDGRSMPGELPISVKTGAGIPELLARIVERLQGLDRVEPALLTRERHRIAVADAIAALERALAARHGQSELLAEELRIAVLALERLVGRIDVEDVLDRLFSGFCIGN